MMTAFQQLRVTPPSSDPVWIGRHQFLYVSGDNRPDDGLNVLCPHFVQVSGESLASGDDLAHGNIMFGTLNLSFTNSLGSFAWSDWEMHGHSVYVTNDNRRAIDHATGRIDLPPNGTATVGYLHATQPGRWVRQLAPDDPIYLSELGGYANMPQSNNYHKLCWAIERAHETGRELVIDGRYYHWGGAIELHDGQVIRGTPGSAIIINAHEVMQRFRKDLGNHEWQFGNDKPYYDGFTYPTWVQKPNCKRITICDLELDGGIMQWVGLDAGGEFHEPDKYDHATLRNSFQNSPAYGGLAVGNQNNRPFEGLHVLLRNVHVHGFMAACVGSPPDNITWDTDGLTIGDCLGNRLWYRGPGVHRNTRTYGVAYAGPARHHGVTIDRWVHTAGETDPWEGIDNYAGEVQLDGGVSEHHAEVINGADWTHATITGAPRNLHFTGVLRYDRPLKDRAVAFFGYLRPTDEVFPVRMRASVALLSTNPDVKPSPLQHYWPRAAWASDVEIRAKIRVEGYVPPMPVEDSAGKFEEWQAAHGDNAVVWMKRNPGSPEQQFVRLILDDEVHRFVLVHTPDLTTEPDLVPTTIEISGVVNNTIESVIATMPGWGQAAQESYEGLPLLVRCKDLLFDWISGRRPGYVFPRQLFEVLTFENCRTRDGKTSEDSGEIDVPAGSPVTVDTELFTRPPDRAGCTVIDGAADYEWVGTESAPQLKLTAKPGTPSGPNVVRWAANMRK